MRSRSFICFPHLVFLLEGAQIRPHLRIGESRDVLNPQRYLPNYVTMRKLFTCIGTSHKKRVMCIKHAKLSTLSTELSTFESIKPLFCVDKLWDKSIE